MTERGATGEGRVRPPIAVFIGAMLLTWPALVNGYPLLYPDSMSYLGDGRGVAEALFLNRLSTFAGMRSEIYSLGIFPFHWNVSAWPIVGLQAGLTAYVLWLVVRSLVAWRPELKFVALLGAVSLLTSLSWYVCLIMPDILGPVLYLCVYLLAFAWGTLSLRERWIVGGIACWSVASHATHLMLAVALCALLGVLLLLRVKAICWRGVVEVAAIVAIAASAQIALHGYLYGDASLNGNRAPYMMARVIADGPGRWYLQRNCGHLQWAICERVESLPETDDEFLWADGGVWASASAATQTRLLQEEMPLVIASLRAYPRVQLQKSMGNFWQEFNDFGLWDFCPNAWVDSELDHVLPGAEARYLRTRQASNALPNRFFTRAQQGTVMVSAALIVGLLPVLWNWRRSRMLGLVVTIVPVVIANAFITAVLSEPDSRYQSRVIWLIPMLAGLVVLDVVSCWREHPRRERREGTVAIYVPAIP